MLIRTLICLGLTTGLTLGLTLASAHAAPWANKAGVALDGYDVVAYHTQDKAVRGSATHSVKHDGVTFQFANAEHKAAFVAAPGKYLPAYDGHCAFAMGMGKGKAPTDPKTFKLYNGRLLLFFNDLYEGKPQCRLLK